jgi:hypothetical protein
MSEGPRAPAEARGSPEAAAPADGAAGTANGGAAEPLDANALRGHHFRRLIGKPAVLVLIGVLVVAAGTACAIFVSALIGAGAAFAVLLLALLVVLVIADLRAADSFFAAYAQERGMELNGRSPLPAVTPLLQKGDERYAERSLSGPFAEGLEGILALYTYEEESTDSEGNRQTNYYRYTVGMVNVPECSQLVPELFCQRKFGLRSMEKVEDVFRRSKERVRLESDALDKKYEIFTGKGQDNVWLRRLFSPTFIVWLSDDAPKKFAFELVGGNLCCYVHGHEQRAEELDGMRAATATVATRLRDESME